jgi:hypothetical protein
MGVAVGVAVGVADKKTSVAVAVGVAVVVADEKWTNLEWFKLTANS